MSERFTATQLRREVALEAHFFKHWEHPPEGQHSLMSGEIVQVLTAAAGAVVMIDNELKAAKGVVERLKELYEWIQSVKAKSPSQKKAKSLSVRERLIIMLVDDHITAQPCSTTQRLASIIGHDVEDCRKQLLELAEMGVVEQEEADRWFFKVD